MGLRLRTQSFNDNPAGNALSVKGSALSYAEGDSNFIYLLTNMSGSNISITGSTGIRGNTSILGNVTLTTGSLTVNAIGGNAVIFKGLTTSQPPWVLMYESASGQIYYTASAALTDTSSFVIYPVFSSWTGSAFSRLNGTASYALTASLVTNIVSFTGSVSAITSVGTASFQITSGSTSLMIISSSGGVGFNTVRPTGSFHIIAPSTTGSRLSFLVENADRIGGFRIYDNGWVSSPGSNPTSRFNEIIGAFAGSGSKNAGDGNCIFGVASLQRAPNTSRCVSIGFNAMGAVTSSGLISNSVAIGQSALGFQVAGVSNTAVGSSAMVGATGRGLYGDRNTAVGASTLASLTFTTYNSALGERAGTNLSLGSYNTLVGGRSFFNNRSSSFNSTLGYLSLDNFVGTGSDYNVAVGAFAGTGLTTGIFNTILGSNTNVASPSSSYAVAIGDGTGSIRIYSPSSSNVILGSTVDTGHKLYVSGSGISGSLNINNILIVSSSNVTITGSLSTQGLRVSGSVVITGSVLFNDVITLPFKTQLPPTRPTGSIALSGSGGIFEGMYVFNGSTWIKIGP